MHTYIWMYEHYVCVCVCIEFLCLCLTNFVTLWKCPSAATSFATFIIINYVTYLEVLY